MRLELNSGGYLRWHPSAHVSLLRRPMDECQVIILHLHVSIVAIRILQMLWHSNLFKMSKVVFIQVNFLDWAPICGWCGMVVVDLRTKHHEWVCKHSKVDQESVPIY